MNVKIVESGFIESINIEKINQWCGLNVIHKNECINSIYNYFSGARSKIYSSNNVLRITIDGNDIGKGYYQTIVVENRNQIISLIQNVKNGLVFRVIHNRLNTFDSECKLEEIDTILSSVFSDINTEVLNKLGNINLDYERETLWSIIQKCDLRTENGDYLESLSTYEMLEILINTLVRIQSFEPEKCLVIIKDIDHLIDSNEYKRFLLKSEVISNEYDISFLFSLSLPGYVTVNEKLIEGITVFNDMVYSLPDALHFNQFINEYYPCQKEFSSDEVFLIIEDIAHYINNSKLPIYSLQSIVFQKMINSSNMVTTKSLGWVNKIETQYITGSRNML